MQLFLAELMVFGKTAGEEQLVPAGTKPGLFWDPVRGSSSSDPPAQGQVALAPTWPNPPVPQVTLAEQGDVGLTGQCGRRDPVPPHSMGSVLLDTHPRQGHPEVLLATRATCPCPPVAPSPALAQGCGGPAQGTAPG